MAALSASADHERAPRAQPRSSPAWLRRNDEINQRARQAAEHGDIGLLFLGDSLVEGWLRQGRQIWDRFYAPRSAANFGIGGDETAQLLWRVQNGNLDGIGSPRRGSPPRAVVLLIGTNNLKLSSSDQIVRDIRALVQEIRQRLPSSPVLLLGIFPRRKWPAAMTKIRAVNAELASTADGEGFAYLDLGPALLQGAAEPAPDLMPDSVHLSTRAYEIWADAMEPTLQALAEQAEPETLPSASDRHPHSTRSGRKSDRREEEPRGRADAPDRARAHFKSAASARGNP